MGLRIERIVCYPVRIPLKPERRMRSALGAHAVSEYVVIRIETQAGIDGVGEATVMPRWSGETAHSALAAIERLFAPQLVGCDPHDIVEIDRRMDRVAQDNWFAKAAVEMACWDICGKEAGRPVYELLGGAVRPPTIRCRFSMGAYETARARQLAAELVDAGFQTIKVKVGTDPKADAERIRAVREVIGPERELVIDANAGWDAETAVRFVRENADCRIALFEQPTPRHDYEGLAHVRREGGVAVMADDTVFDFAQAEECILHQACDVISLYPGKQGGIRKARAIAERAAEAGVAAGIGSNLELDIATAAMGHFVLATPNVQVEQYPGDMLGPDYHAVSLVREPLAIEGPLVTLPDRPGLGVDVDWAVVEAHRLEL